MEAHPVSCVGMVRGLRLLTRHMPWPMTATLKVTAAGGQIANVTVTQAAGDSTIELDKETINLDVNGTQQTVNVTSNDSWTWAQAAARTVLRMMGR